ncbi:MAG: hypothetical protein U0L72_06630, partial [Acutalibacteraceae bacterium]|nr:hypothetical protein [Acutalibacteraceae bacterium]
MIDKNMYIELHLNLRCSFYIISSSIFPFVFLFNDISITNTLKTAVVIKPALPPKLILGSVVKLEKTLISTGFKISNALKVNN